MPNGGTDTYIFDAQRAHGLANDAWPIQPRTYSVHALPGVTGTGTSLANAFAGGWENFINNWTTDGVTFDFPAGHYSFSNTISPVINYIALRGGPGVHLHYTGTGRAVSFDARTFGGNGYFFYFVTMDGFNIDSPAKTMGTGLYYDQVEDGYFSNISVDGFSLATTNTIGFDFQFGVCNAHRNLISRGSPTVATNNANTPFVGMRLGSTNSVGGLSPTCQCACTYDTPDIQFSQGIGLWAINGFNCKINGGTLSTTRGNAQDCQVETNFINSTFSCVDFEGLYATSRTTLNGNFITLDSCNGSPGTLTVNSTGNTIWGGNGWLSYTDSTGGNDYGPINGFHASSVTGAGAAFNRYYENNGQQTLGLLTITGGVGGVNYLYLHDASTSGQATYVRYRSERTGHVKEWQLGTGIQDFNAWCLFDSTNGIVPLEVKEDDSLILGAATNKIGFYGGGGAAKQTVTGSRSANAALASLLTALANLGLITDSSS